MKVNEIFSSIDGEGLRTGELATFIRLAGCNLNCSYCDTEYARGKDSGNDMTVEQIIDKVKSMKVKNITITGGEPLIHKDVDKLIDKLLLNKYNINIETNGTVDIEKYLNRCLITMDYKCTSSLMESKMLLSNLEKLTENDVLKFVVQEKDFECMKEVLQKYNLKCYVYISPIFGKIELCKIVDFMKECNKESINMAKLRMQVQLHKIIWDPNERGV